MTSTLAKGPAGKVYAVWAMLPAIALYVLYLLLPVAPEPYGGPGTIRGYEGLMVCFTLPALWPIAAGHVLLWVGAGLLVGGCWRVAALLGVVALVLSSVFVVGMLIGYYAKLASMGALTVASVVGWLRFDRAATAVS